MGIAAATRLSALTSGGARERDDCHDDGAGARDRVTMSDMVTAHARAAAHDAQAAGSLHPMRGRDASARGPRFAGLIRSAGWFTALLAGLALLAAVLATGATEPVRVPAFDPGPVINFGIPIARTLLDLGAVVVVGVALLARLIGFDRPERSEPVLRPARVVEFWAAVVWTGAALVSIVLLTAELQLGAVPTPADVWTYVTEIPAGKGLLLSAGCGVVAALLARLTRRHGEKVPAELRAGVGLFGLLPLPLTGHASNWDYHDLSMISMELHVVAAAAWTGALGAVVIFLSRHRDLLAIALPRFSRLATWCVVIVGVTGLFNGVLELALSPLTTLPASLWGTRYGVLILAKSVLMVAVAVIAVRVRTRLLPRIATGRPGAVALWCGWELIVLTLAFGVAVVLTRTSVTPF